MILERYVCLSWASHRSDAGACRVPAGASLVFASLLGDALAKAGPWDCRELSLRGSSELSQSLPARDVHRRAGVQVPSR